MKNEEEKIIGKWLVPSFFSYSVSLRNNRSIIFSDLSCFKFL